MQVLDTNLDDVSGGFGPYETGVAVGAAIRALLSMGDPVVLSFV